MRNGDLQVYVIGLSSTTLAWVQVSPERWVAELKQAHAVERYKLQVNADLAILQRTLLRGQALAAIGMANLVAEERGELAGILRGLVSGIDQTLGEIEHTMARTTGMLVPLGRVTDNDEVVEVLEVIESAISGAREITATNGDALVDRRRATTIDHGPVGH